MALPYVSNNNQSIPYGYRNYNEYIEDSRRSIMSHYYRWFENEVNYEYKYYLLIVKTHQDNIYNVIKTPNPLNNISKKKSNQSLYGSDKIMLTLPHSAFDEIRNPRYKKIPLYGIHDLRNFKKIHNNQLEYVFVFIENEHKFTINPNFRNIQIYDLVKESYIEKRRTGGLINYDFDNYYKDFKIITMILNWYIELSASNIANKNVVLVHLDKIYNDMFDLYKNINDNIENLKKTHSYYRRIRNFYGFVGDINMDYGIYINKKQSLINYMCHRRNILRIGGVIRDQDISYIIECINEKFNMSNLVVRIGNVI